MENGSHNEKRNIENNGNLEAETPCLNALEARVNKSHSAHKRKTLGYKVGQFV